MSFSDPSESRHRDQELFGHYLSADETKEQYETWIERIGVILRDDPALRSIVAGEGLDLSE